MKAQLGKQTGIALALLATLLATLLAMGVYSVAQAQASPSASRSFEPATVQPGGDVVVTIAISNFGQAGHVRETLPAGFTYVSSSLGIDNPTGNQVEFLIIGGINSFTYTVSAPATEGDYSFSGQFRPDRGAAWEPVGGDTMVTVSEQSDNAYLSSLSLSDGTLMPAFAMDTMAYTASVDNSVDSVTVSATAAHANASVTGTGDHDLMVGENTITVTVTAEDGSTMTYTVTVTRAQSSNAYLSSLSLSDGTLMPAFAGSTMAYTASVDNSVDSVTVTAMAADDTATVTGAGDHDLMVGENTITVMVTAQDGSTMTYTVTVTRAQSSNAYLRSLSLSAGTLMPAFAGSTMAYTASVDNSVDSVTVNAEAADAANASVTGDGDHDLMVGANTITVTVTAQDGSTMDYTVTVNRAGSSNANLSSLSLSAGTLMPAFDMDTTAYKASVDNSVDSVTVNAEAADAANASVTGDGDHDLMVGANTITVTVTAQDGGTKAYTITVTRAPSATLTTNKASSATRLTIVGGGAQLGEVGPGDEIVINLDKFGLPGSIDEADVTIDDGDNIAEPRSVSVSGSNITLLLGKFASNESNSHSANVIDSMDGEIEITIRDRAGITTPTKAGMYEVKVDAKDRSDNADTYDLSGDGMMVSIIRSISVDPKSAVRGTEITITGKGFTDGSAGVMAGTVSIGAADIVDGSFTLTVNNNLKVNNNDAFVKGPGGNVIDATDGAGDSADETAKHTIKATFTVKPESPNPGQEVTITLADTNVMDDSTVSVSFGGKAVEDDKVNDAGDGKDATWKVTVPTDVRRGTVQMRVTVKSEDGTTTDSLTKNITIATNPLTVTPSTVVPGQSVSVSGSGFQGASTIDIGDVKIGSLDANTAVLLVNNVGGVTFDVSIPDRVATGEVKVKVTDSAGRVGEATITVTKAALTLNPEESLIGSDIMVSGVGFPANDLVLIKYNNNTITTANTDSTGTFSKSIVVPTRGIATGGSYSVTAEPQINKEHPGASKTHKTPKPAVTLSSATATAGSSITIEGANFKGFLQVYKIEIGGQNVSTLPAPATDRWGSFSATVQVPQLSPGRYAVKATVEDEGGDSATEFLQVVEEVIVVSTAPADVFASLGDRLSRVWHLDRATQQWSFYDPDPDFAAFNTLDAVSSGQVVQIIITDGDTVDFQGTTLYAGTNPIALD